MSGTAFRYNGEHAPMCGSLLARSAGAPCALGVLCVCVAVSCAWERGAGGMSRALLHVVCLGRGWALVVERVA